MSGSRALTPDEAQRRLALIQRTLDGGGTLTDVAPTLGTTPRALSGWLSRHAPHLMPSRRRQAATPPPSPGVPTPAEVTAMRRRRLTRRRIA